MLPLLLIVFLLLELMILMLDLWQLRAAPEQESQRPSIAAFGFLFIVTLVFLLIQLAGSSLVPSARQVLAFLRDLADHHSTAATEPGQLAGGPAMLLAAVLFYTAGFWDYVVHRTFSHSRWFWLTHEYHHLPRQVSVVMPGILVRPFAFIPGFLTTVATGLTVYTMCLVCGLPIWDLEPVIPTLLVIVLLQTASHSCFLRRRWWLHRWLRIAFLTSPQDHVLHHTVDSRCNYGNFTTLWDRALQTYVDPTGIDLESLPLGLSYDQDFLGTLTLGKCKLPPSIRRRFQVGRFCHVNDAEESATESAARLTASEASPTPTQPGTTRS